MAEWLSEIDSDGSDDVSKDEADWPDEASFLSACQNEDIERMREILGHDVSVLDRKRRCWYRVLRSACVSGKLEIVKVLLSKEACGADQSLKDVLRPKGCEPVLHLACRFRNIEMVKLILSKGANVNEEDAYGRQPLEIAASNGDLDVVKILVEHGANKDRGIHATSHWKQDVDQNSAIVSCRSVIVQFLLSRGANINHLEDKHGRAPLCNAIRYGSLEMVELLLSHGANADLKDNRGELQIMFAFEQGSLEIQKALLKHVKSMDGLRRLDLLGRACRAGDLEMVKLLISKGANPNERNFRGRTPFHDACEEGNIEIVQLLLLNGAELDFQNDKGEDLISPLYVACREGHLDIAELLVAHGAKVNLKCPQGTPLHSACYSGDLEIVRLLLSNGASVEEQYHFSGTPLHVATCCNEDLEIVNFLLSLGARVDCQDARGDTPLHLACRRGIDEKIELFLSAGAATNIQNDSRCTPLHYACQGGGPKIIELFLSAGAATNIQDDSGCTPLHYACQTGGPETVQLLLSNGARVDIQDMHGLAPLHLACRKEDELLVDILLYNGADADVKDNDGRRPLVIAFSSHNIEIQKKLLNHGVSIGYDAYLEGSPLHTASGNGTIEIVRLLLSKGANVNESDHRKLQPLYYACEEGHLDTARILINHGALLDGDDLEHTPLEAACEGGHISLVQMLLNEMVNTNVLSTGNLHHPLIKACRRNHFEIVKLLLNHGAKVNIPDGYGNCPLYFAVSDEVARMLIINGADVNAANRKGETALTCNYTGDEPLRSPIKVLLDYGAGSRRRCLRDKCKCQTSELMCAYAGLEEKIHTDFGWGWGIYEDEDFFEDTLVIKYQVDSFERYFIQTKAAGKSFKRNGAERSLWDQQKIDHFKATCESELSLMKKNTINNTDVSFYDLLTFNLTTPQYQQILENFSDEECLRMFPVYGDMTISKYLAVRKLSLIEQSIPFFNLTQPPLLPECARDVLAFLSIADLNTLNEFC